MSSADDLAICDDLKARLYATIDAFADERGNLVSGDVIFVLGEMMAESHCKHAIDKFDVKTTLQTIAEQFVIELRKPTNRKPEENKNSTVPTESNFKEHR